MQMVLLTALGVGGATVIGAAFGFAFKTISHRFSDIVLSFAAGVMLAAAVIGLVLPALESGGAYALPVAVIGIFCGALCINLFDRVVPHLHRLSGVDQEEHPARTAQLNKVLLFVTAIAIHNLPEGIAAGVGFGTGDVAGAVTVALGIALQNIPEGMVIIAPMLAVGMSRGRTFGIALFTGLVEVVGTLLTDYSGCAAWYDTGTDIAVADIFDNNVTNGPQLRADGADGKTQVVIVDMGENN